MGEEKKYFDELEEAIVAECTKKLHYDLAQHSLFANETKAMQKIRDWMEARSRRIGMYHEKNREAIAELKFIPNSDQLVMEAMLNYDNEELRQSYVVSSLVSMNNKGEMEMFERYEERSDLYKLLNEIVEKSDRKFENSDQVFALFARANFSGNYLPLARVVENILGEGSFRKIAEDFARKDKPTP